ncbi:MAG: ATP-binding cassette domain-containing protein [Xanthobacteraceae bacterium]
MTETGHAIEFDNIIKRFGDGQTIALDRVSLAIAPREFLTIVGQSGSGKTTLLRLINRLTEPTDGVVRFAGEDVRAVDPIALRRRVGYVFQGVGLFPHMTVAENIAITPRLLGWDRKKRDARVDVLLALVRLLPSEYRYRFPRELSGGERQRVGVARAVAAEPHVVLMDEPFGALDPLTRDAVGQDYRRLHDELGLTTVMITHDILGGVLLADRIAVLHQGKLIEEGTPHKLMTAAKHDYVRELMQTPRTQAARLRKLMEDGPQ